jgi:hypothetical protein
LLQTAWAVTAHRQVRVESPRQFRNLHMPGIISGGTPQASGARFVIPGFLARLGMFPWVVICVRKKNRS